MNITNKRTKLIATIGPSSETKEVMKELAKNGMTTIRANFSHGNRIEQVKKFKVAEEIGAETGKPISIMLDTKGPEIRVGTMKDGAQQIKANSLIKLKTGDAHFGEHIGTDKEFSISYKMAKDVRNGDKVLFDDGKLSGVVESVLGDDVFIRMINSHLLKTNKRINLPGIDFSLPFLSKKDIEDIKFGVKHNIHYIAASFVNNAHNIAQIRKILKEENAEHVQIVAKIESVLGIQNIESIINAADGIMVARGDLGLEIPYQDVPYWQKFMIRKCRLLGKPVIVATQMLDSMENSTQPTRAEVTDVYYAAEQGADATMLSGETASGKFPALSVKTMSIITLRAEKEFYNKYFYPLNLRKIADISTGPRAEMAIKISEKLIFGEYRFAVVLSKTGELLKTISKFRPNAAIIGISENPHSLHSFGIWSSVFMVENKNNLFRRIKENHKCSRELLKIYNAKKGDKYIVVENENFKEYVY